MFFITTDIRGEIQCCVWIVVNGVPVLWILLDDPLFRTTYSCSYLKSNSKIASFWQHWRRDLELDSSAWLTKPKHREVNSAVIYHHLQNWWTSEICYIDVHCVLCLWECREGIKSCSWLKNALELNAKRSWRNSIALKLAWKEVAVTTIPVVGQYKHCQ